MFEGTMKMMNKIISDVHNAEQNSRKTVEFLTTQGKKRWIEGYPIALVNERKRITEEESLRKLAHINFFDEEGFSKKTYTQKEIIYLKEHVPLAIKTAYCLCVREEQKDTFDFQEKFKHDRWKKIQDDGNFLAMLSASKFKETDSSIAMETVLRDIMRSAKEIPAMKAIGFIWVVTLPKSSKIVDILEHYFLDNHVFIEKGRKITYIAWGDKLADINMRYFVNTPK